MTQPTAQPSPSAPPQAGAGLPEDSFTVYVTSRLLPFVRKRLGLLIVLALAAMVAVAVHGIWRSRQRTVERATLNDIFRTVSAAKEITPAVLEELDARYKGQPAAIEVRWRLAGEYVRAGAYDKAAAVYREIIAANGALPLAVHARLALGSCLEQANDLPGALNVYAEGWQTYRSHPRVAAYFLYRTALVEFQKGDFDGTEHNANKAMNLMAEAVPEDRLRPFDADFGERLVYLRNLADANIKKKG